MADPGRFAFRGVSMGGWMNRENFINGYPGSEHGVRAALVEALGASKEAFFFERLLHHVLGDADIEFLAWPRACPPFSC